ncbi:hypothetical protein [Catenibacillus scindens]|uniref:hypothetical protein n=1 Tax=Catenibacillus scindens TaxID=673271 RepID=UPI00320B47DF
MKRRWRYSVGFLLLALLIFGIQCMLLRDIPEGRVEIISEDNQLEMAALLSEKSSLSHLKIQEEEGRLVLTGTDLFTAQQVQGVLRQADFSEEQYGIQDYAWAKEVLEQTWTLYKIAVVMAYMILFVYFTASLVRHEHIRSIDEMKKSYFSDYMIRHGVRLLTEIVVVTAAGMLCLLLAQWLWRVHLVLPTGLLPDGSIFQIRHYIEWWNAAFHLHGVSVFGQQLGKQLETITWNYTLFVISLFIAMMNLLFERGKDGIKL